LHRIHAHRPWTIRAALLLVLALVIAACGGGGSGGSEGDQKASSKTGDEKAGDPTPGGKVTLGLEAETANGWCLPEARLDISGIQVARAVYDTLTVPSKDGATFKPFLAESVTPNANFTEWTIKLRPNIKFSDGSALDATVVKNNLDAYRGKYATRHPDLYLFTFQDIKDVTVAGPLTVRVATTKPWSGFPAHLYSSGRFGMMGQSQLDDTTSCATKLVGTGPFVMTSRRVNSGETLKKNPNYWRKDDKGRQLPYLDEIDFKPIPEVQQRANALSSGEIDAYLISSGTGSAIIKDLRSQAKDGKINLTESEKFSEVGNLMLNTSKPPFDDVDARKAVAEAINREQLRSILGFGIPRLANGPFAPGAMGYLKDTGSPEYNPADAKDLVKKYENKSGKKLEVVITAVGETELLKTIDLVKQDLEAAGMKVRVTTVDQSTLIDKAVAGDFSAITWRNYPGFDPDTLYVWWYGASKNPINFSRFDDPKVNELLDKGRQSGDPAERKQIYEDLNRRLNEQYYFAWLSWSTWDVPRIRAVHQVVGGRPVGTDGSDDYDGLAVGFDPALLWREK
jgi:peptide/nickel transport system substrate-binding protein